jgi:hypothetical protein
MDRLGKRLDTTNQIELPFMAKQSAKAEVQAAGYSPLGSVWDGEDSELLENMLAFYLRKRPKLILDATINGGRFWRGSKRPLRASPLQLGASGFHRRRAKSRLPGVRLHREDPERSDHRPEVEKRHHTRRRHTYWLVFRKSSRCE